MSPIAELAFCNDVDFGDFGTYREVHDTLDALGIPAEDSFWLFAPGGSEMALFGASLDEKGPRHEEILEDVRRGRLTVLHGCGDFSCTSTSRRPGRSLLAAGLEYLDQHARIPGIWTNHGDEGDCTNVGGNAPTYHRGDAPGDDAFVLDLLLQAGVRHFWTDHNYRHDFVFHRERGRPDSFRVTERTRSGHLLDCFQRYRGDLPRAPDAQSLAWQLRPQNLQELVGSRGVTVIYQHWFVHRDESGAPMSARSPVLPDDALAALEGLADLVRERQLRVRRLSELLEGSEPT